MSYQLFCENCKFKFFFNKEEEIVLKEYKRNPVQRTLPSYEEGKKIHAQYQNQPKLYKCLKCGYLCKIIKIQKEES